MNNNLPPGVNDYDIPGNRTEDLEWESFFDEVVRDSDKFAIDISDIYKIWKNGLSKYLEVYS